jgi:hypothetical protein
MEERPRGVVAIVVAPDAPERVRRAAASQDVAVDASPVVAPLFTAAPWTDSAVGWLWLLDGTAVPRADALRRLLEAADAAASLPVPGPVLLASKVLAPDGSLDAGRTPWYRRGGGTDLSMRAARERLLPVRAARPSSLLVAREAGLATARTRSRLKGPGASMEWTARLLRDRVGYLVPDSVTDSGARAPWGVQAAGRGGLDDVVITVAMLAGPGWRPREKLWLAAEGAGRGARALMGSAAGAGRR